MKLALSIMSDVHSMEKRSGDPVSNLFEYLAEDVEKNRRYVGEG